MLDINFGSLMEVVMTEFPCLCCLNQEKHINFLILLGIISSGVNRSLGTDLGRNMRQEIVPLFSSLSTDLLAQLDMKERKHHSPRLSIPVCEKAENWA